MGRPRDDSVPAFLGVCQTHGEVEFRIHRVGRRADGSQRTRARCPQCHSDRNLGKSSK